MKVLRDDFCKENCDACIYCCGIAGKFPDILLEFYSKLKYWCM